MAMIPITNMSSISVKAERRLMGVLPWASELVGADELAIGAVRQQLADPER